MGAWIGGPGRRGSFPPQRQERLGKASFTQQGRSPRSHKPADAIPSRVSVARSYCLRGNKAAEKARATGVKTRVITVRPSPRVFAVEICAETATLK